MLVRICDRCKKQITGEKWEFVAKCTDADQGSEHINNFMNSEFCPNCAEEIQVFMACNISIEKEQKKEEKKEQQKSEDKEHEKKKKPAGRKKVDVGRICALYKTGEWSVEKIAMEVDCSVYTVKEKLKDEGIWEYKSNKEKKEWEWTK